jgi:hypothetical protein
MRLLFLSLSGSIRCGRCYKTIDPPPAVVGGNVFPRRATHVQNYVPRSFSQHHAADEIRLLMLLQETANSRASRFSHCCRTQRELCANRVCWLTKFAAGAQNAFRLANPAPSGRTDREKKRKSRSQKLSLSGPIKVGLCFGACLRSLLNENKAISRV